MLLLGLSQSQTVAVTRSSKANDRIWLIFWVADQVSQPSVSAKHWKSQTESVGSILLCIGPACNSLVRRWNNVWKSLWANANMKPGRHEALKSSWFNAGPPSSTLTQHLTNMGSTSYTNIAGLHAAAWTAAFQFPVSRTISGSSFLQDQFIGLWHTIHSLVSDHTPPQPPLIFANLQANARVRGWIF